MSTHFASSHFSPTPFDSNHFGREVADLLVGGIVSDPLLSGITANELATSVASELALSAKTANALATQMVSRALGLGAHRKRIGAITSKDLQSQLEADDIDFTDE